MFSYMLYMLLCVCLYVCVRGFMRACSKKMSTTNQACHELRAVLIRNVLGSMLLLHHILVLLSVESICNPLSDKRNEFPRSAGFNNSEGMRRQIRQIVLD